MSINYRDFPESKLNLQFQHFR